MIGDWFWKWNDENPKNIYGPAILVGAIGGAVFVAIMLVTFGQPYATASVQTGPRGTGMSVAKFSADLAKADPTIEDYYTEEPYEVEPGASKAAEIYENVQVLGDLDEDNFNRLMIAMTQWIAPEQGCAYCHGEGDLETYGTDDLYTKVVSRRMIQMTQAINGDWDGHVGETGVNCYTCHRGQNVPSEIWFRVDPAVEVMDGWAAVQNRVTPVSQFTSLPSDALPKLLVEDGRISVHDLESRVSAEPGDPTWQDTERTYALMNYFSNSLNVNCVFCHNSRAFYDGGQVTPQWAAAYVGIDMVRELNVDYLVPLEGTLPENRLGPIHGDAPKAACKTCHKGYQKPLQGLGMLSDWPELGPQE